MKVLVQDWNWLAIALEGFFLGIVPVFFNGKEHREEYVVKLEPGGGVAMGAPTRIVADAAGP